MDPVFRVEAFIMPISNRRIKSNGNIIDDEKVVDKFKSIVETSHDIKLLNSKDETDDRNISEEINEKSSCKISNNFMPEIKINLSVNSEDETEKRSKEKNEIIVKSIIEKNNEKKIEKKETENDEYKYVEEQMESNCDLSNPLMIKKAEPIKLRERFEIDEYVTLKTVPNLKKEKVKFGRSLVGTTSLRSIDERGETPENCNDEFCCHGYKNGCTAITQKPESVTEGIFEVNWLRRLEQLRAREVIIKDKEASLFERERLLFKKERELRILERLVKDKLKYIELYLKRCESQNSDSIEFDIANKGPEQFKNSQFSKATASLPEKLNSIETSGIDQRIINNTINNKKLNSEIKFRESSKLNGLLDSRTSLTSERILKNPPNSRSSLTDSIGGQCHIPKSDAGSSYLTNRNTFTGLTSHNSLRIKKRPKITYDDLDSTLSADIGDSSFVVTSRKFNPEIFKKPSAFRRSFSERRNSRTFSDRLPESPPPPPLSSTEDMVHNIDEEKLLKRINENILISQDKNTKLQHYGLIDNGSNECYKRTLESDNIKRYSYLNLEDGTRGKKNQLKSENKRISSRERPISWNEETNEWLQKKRQAYNLQTAKKILKENIHCNKENYDSETKFSQVSKKASKGKRFHLFN